MAEYTFSDQDVLAEKARNPTHGARRIARSLLPPSPSERELRRAASKVARVLAYNDQPTATEVQAAAPAPERPAAPVAHLPRSRLEAVEMVIAEVRADLDTMREAGQWQPYIAAQRLVAKLLEERDALLRSAQDVDVQDITRERVMALLRRLPRSMLLEALD